jgi:cell division septation protein DedD
MNETGFTNIRIEMADAPLFKEDEDSVPEIMAVTVSDDSKPSAPLPPARTQNPVAQSDIPRISVSVLEAVTEPDVSIKVLVTINGQEYVLELPGNAGTAQGQSGTSSASSRSNANASSSASSAAGATSFCGVKVIPKMPDPRGGGVFRVQVGSFSNTALAQECFDRLTSNGLKPSFERFGKMHRVVLSGIKAGDMVQVVQRLGDAGVAEAWLRREN